MARALADAGLPKGVLAIVFGVPHEVSMHLIASPIIRKVSFTGSIPVGKQLVKLAADGMKRTTMELGGHAPVLVFDDVDVEKVLDMCVTAKYRNAGQVCVSPTRFYVQESIYQKFAEGFAARAKALPVGDGIDEANRMGPLAHARRLAGRAGHHRRSPASTARGCSPAASALRARATSSSPPCSPTCRIPRAS